VEANLCQCQFAGDKKRRDSGDAAST